MRRFTGQLGVATELLIDDCLAALRDKYHIEQMRNSSVRRLLHSLDGCATALGEDSTELVDAFDFSRRSASGALAIYMHEFHVHGTKYNPSGHWDHAVHLLAVMEPRHDLGRVLMRPETFGDKIADLFTRSDVDFRDHPQFSSRYHVLASDEELLRRKLSNGFLDAVAQRKDLLVEINGKTLALTALQPMNADNAVVIADLALRAAEALR